MSYFLFCVFSLAVLWIGVQIGRDREREEIWRQQNSLAEKLRMREIEALRRQLLGVGKERE